MLNSSSFLKKCCLKTFIHCFVVCSAAGGGVSGSPLGPLSTSPTPHHHLLYHKSWAMSCFFSKTLESKLWQLLFSACSFSLVNEKQSRKPSCPKWALQLMQQDFSISAAQRELKFQSKLCLSTSLHLCSIYFSWLLNFLCMWVAQLWKPCCKFEWQSKWIKTMIKVSNSSK